MTGMQTQSALSKYAQGIDHLAIAVRDLEGSIIWFTQVLGFSLIERRRTEGAATGMISAVLQAGTLTIVLLEGTHPMSQVSLFVERYGPGVQHVAIRISDIDAVVKDLIAHGLEFDTPIIEGGGLRQAFSRRDPASGLMIELIQRNAEGFADQNVSALFQELERKGSF